MFKMNIIKPAIVILVAALFISGCRKRESAEMADNLAYFEYTSQGIEEATNSLTVKLKLVRPVDKDVPVVLNLTETGLVYGTDYTTTPATVGGKLNLTLPSGNNEASFTITKVAGALFDGDEKIVFDLYSSGAPVFIGNPKQLTITFKELVATSASMTGIGSNSTAGNFDNKVFFDLSANRQTPISRTAWDLGFYTGADDFRVTINATTAMMAKPLAKNDLNAVTAADTIGFGNELTIGAFGVNPATLPFIDYPNGDLTRTAIALVSATAADNKVYIINRGNGIGATAPPARGWKKVRIIRNATGGYTLQYADIAATTFSSIDIAKDEAYFFKYISFETGAVSVEPQKKKWDLAWTYFTNTFGTGASEAPFMFQDMIIQNRNVSVATVLVATKAFDAFTEADIAAQTFSTSQIKIGSDWRTTQPVAAKADRYYIVKDGDNNYYKVKFTGITQNGVRGFPALQSVLVKRG